MGRGSQPRSSESRAQEHRVRKLRAKARHTHGLTIIRSGRPPRSRPHRRAPIEDARGPPYGGRGLLAPGAAAAMMPPLPGRPRPRVPPAMRWPPARTSSSLRRRRVSKPRPAVAASDWAGVHRAVLGDASKRGPWIDPSSPASRGKRARGCGTGGLSTRTTW